MFELTKSQKEIQKAAREFARGEFDKDMAREREKTGGFPQTVWQRAAALGFIGIQFPEASAGGGMGVFEAVLLNETLCRMDSSLGGALAGAAHGAECLARFGNDAQQADFLAPVAEGRMRSAGAFLEPGGSLLAVPRTEALPDDDGWVLRGRKAFVPNAGQAGVYLVLCRTAPGDSSAPESAVSMLIVKGDAAGIEARPEGRCLGGNLIPAGEVTFDDVQVPSDHLLGRPGRGLRQMAAWVDEHRILLAGQAVGIAQGALDRALAHVKQRVQFNRKIAAFQVTRHKIATMATRVETARVMTYQAAQRFDRGKCDARTAAMAKWTAARAAVAVADEAIQLHGGYGYMREYDVERFYRDAKAIALTAGAGGTLKDVIGEATIGRLR